MIEGYERAPYLELDNYKAPKGVNSIFIQMPDAKKIKLMYWNLDKDNQSGTVLIQQGHNEFIEKYYETIQEFLNRNYSVVAFDWRGQGMSEKMIDQSNKQYIENFKIHDQDLEYIYNKIIRNFKKPLIGVGHSMGGFILLSTLKNNKVKFEKVILSAPMLGFNSEKILMKVIDLLYFFLPKKNLLPGSNPNMGKEIPFEGNDLTSDNFRYKRTQMLVRLKKDIRLWGVTIAWAKAVKKQLLVMRKKGWAETIKNQILFLNNINDRVVSAKEITKMSNRLDNSKIVYFEETEHEIFMEKDQHREIMWKAIDNFLKN